METRQYDVAVLGAGPGGYVAALRAAMRGARVCCIDAGRIGGTCLNVGCIPTKAMLHASELYYQISHAAELGITTGEPRLDSRALMQRTQKVVDNLRKGVAGLLKARKVDFIAGRGKLIAADAIEVAEGGMAAGSCRHADASRAGNDARHATFVKAKAIIIATGSRPARPEMLPWDSGHVITTDEATQSEQLPPAIAIVGGGVIGCEFATYYSELGVVTTVVEMMDRLVSTLDEDASRLISRSLAKRKVEVLTGARIVSARASADAVTLELDRGPGGQGKSIEAPCVLAAMGRPANTEDIGLEALGVAMDDAIIRVDDRCRTNVPGVYAIGDVAERRQYAHLASRMGVVAADNATGHDAADDRAVVPVGVYTHPEVAAVGMSEAQARAAGEIKVTRFPYLASGMAQAYAQTEGMVKLVADAATGRLLGGLIIGQHATDSIHEVALAVRKGMTVEDVAALIHAHPTFAEAIGEAAEGWLGMPIHTMH